MKHLNFVILIFLLGIVFESTAQDTLKLVGGNYPPWRMVEKGQLTGIDIDIWKEIAKKMDELKTSGSMKETLVISFTNLTDEHYTAI